MTVPEIGRIIVLPQVPGAGFADREHPPHVRRRGDGARRLRPGTGPVVKVGRPGPIVCDG